jgi:hypothetical protein
MPSSPTPSPSPAPAPSPSPSPSPGVQQVLGQLICDLNPYSKTIDLYLNAPAAGATPPDISQIDLEADTNYPSEWEFKEQKQRINAAVRIKYRYAVGKDKSKPISGDNPIAYWIEDYLLIGYEGAGGP